MHCSVAHNQKNEDPVIYPGLTELVAKVENCGGVHYLIARHQPKHLSFVVVSDYQQIGDISVVPFPALVPLLIIKSKESDHNKDKIQDEDADCATHCLKTQDRSCRPGRGKLLCSPCQRQCKRQRNGPNSIYEHPTPFRKRNLEVSCRQLVDSKNLTVHDHKFVRRKRGTKGASSFPDHRNYRTDILLQRSKRRNNTSLSFG
mmetsp:Transcript_94312/g.141313  ORF Transcript_94312/g.141313 Transcript_94312/m.141313 type:complete len:202 (-) Transcript_94312:1033-1638(-)